MEKRLLFLLLPLAIACGDLNKNKQKNPKMDFKKIPVSYIFSRKDTTVVDNYFGTKIKDPYRWLEDDRSTETTDWVRKQNAVTMGYLSQIPYRDQIKQRLEQIWNYEKYGAPFKEAGKLYFFKNDGLQNQSVLYHQENDSKEPTVILNPNTFSTDGTSSLQEMGFSKNGKYLAYSISKGGSDWRTIHVKDLETGKELPDLIEWAKFTAISWKNDGFFYSRYPTPGKGQELTEANQMGAIYYHKLGNAQAADELIYADHAHPDYYFAADVTDDERFLVLNISESTSGNKLYIKDLNKKEIDFTPIKTNFDHDFQVVDNIGDKLVILTNHKAPNQRLILVNSEHPEESFWETLIAEDSSDVLQSAGLMGGKIVCQYLHNASSAVRIYSLEGKFEREIALPEIGTVGEIRGKKEDNKAYFSFTSFLRPTSILELDLKTGESKVFKAPKIDFNPDHFTTEQVWFTSKDGAKVPMFITRKKNISKDGSNPTVLYGYGGFNISVTPSFSVTKAALLEKNGIYCVANIRGGGEFGEKWHKSGTKCQKQNVFNDFIGAAEYLIDQKYTSPERLAIEGGSNGGLLVGACMTQRPDLFGVCFPRVGVLDMLRYHKFTIGYAWASDYGKSDNEKEFDCLIAYSPLHNVEKTNYPATMVMTADHDDRVVPAHSFKFAATLQENQKGEAPVLIRIDTSAGHGAGKPTSKLIDEAADILAFMWWNMKITW